MKKGKLLFVALLITTVALLTTTLATAGGQKMRFDQIRAQMEITQLTTTYAWAIDNKDLDALMSIFVEGEPGDAVYPIYDISALQIPGLDRVEGTTAIRGFMEFAVLPGEPFSSSHISNVNVIFNGKKTATGGDYYIHNGYVPVEIDGNGNVLRRYSQFVPTTYDLLCEPDTFVRAFKEGQHLYDFIYDPKNGWKIEVFISSPTFSGADEVIYADQISPAKIPWDPMFDDMADCD
jgi:hypothetical protein